MENTLENKAKFFAQYWGQNILHRKDGSYVSICFLNPIDDRFLTLKPISSITDEDSQRVREIMHWPNRGITSVSQTIVLLNMNMFPMILTDYLRSKGYALPWMGLPLEKQIEYGWIKLATS